jgi:Zn-dependent protease with chaperone function
MTCLIPSARPLGRLFVTLLTATLGGSLAGCNALPFASTKAAPASSATDLLALSQTEFDAYLLRQPMSNHQESCRMVERVGQRIASASGKADSPWQFVLISSSEPNIFCLPGGRIGVTEGLLPICHNEAGLAAAMSHEVAHSVAQHGSQRMQKSRGYSGVFASMMNDSRSEEERFQLAYGMTPAARAELPYTREQELEADSIGLQLMARAGYDPREAPRFWERMGMSDRQNPPKPDELTARINQMQKSLPGAIAYYNQSKQHGLGMVISLPAPAPDRSEIARAGHEGKTRQTAKLVQTADAASLSNDPFLDAAPASPAAPKESAAGMASLEDFTEATDRAAEPKQTNAPPKKPSATRDNGWKGEATAVWAQPVPLEPGSRLPRPTTDLSDMPLPPADDHWRKSENGVVDPVKWTR